MKYRFKKHHSKISTILVTFDAGSRVEYQSKYPSGIAHFMEHMRFKGTENKSAKQLLNEIADFGGRANAFTSQDCVSYIINAPDEKMEDAFRCLAEIVNNPVYPEDELEKEKGVVCQEIRMYDDDIDSLVSDKMMSCVFDNCLRGRICGSEESVNSITKKDLLDFNRQFYSKECMLVSLASNKNRLDLVEKYFGVPDGKVVFPKIKKSKILPGGEFFVEKQQQLQNVISVAFRSKHMEKIDRAKLNVFNRVFGNGDVSRLFMSVREDLGLVYGISSGDATFIDGAFYDIETQTEPQNSELVLNEINKQIDLIRKEYVSEEELYRVKNKIRSSIYGSMDSSSSAAFQIMSEEIYKSDKMKKFLKKIDAVTKEDVIEIANKVFDGERYVVIGKNKE